MLKLFNSIHCNLRNFISRYAALMILSALLNVISSLNLHAQDVHASAKADTNAITIGNQFTVDLTVTHPANIKTEWPVFADTFSMMEVIQRSSIDTISAKGSNSVTRHQKIVLTSFDSGYHVLPPFAFLYRSQGDTAFSRAETKPILITVNTIPVDTTRAFKDIKGQVVIPYSWQDALPYIFGFLIAVAIAFLIYRYYKKRKSKVVTPEIAIPKRPAHEIALEALRNLDESKLWQNGNYKGYYTGLSDITRTFIQNRWSMTAMEMTTDEILRLKIISDQNQEVFSKLKYMLELSDMVKFAKTVPVVYENEQSMQNAHIFIEANKQLLNGKEDQE